MALSGDGWGFQGGFTPAFCPDTVTPITSPCNPCLSVSFLMSVWLTYQPFFRSVVIALSGPLPLLVVLLDIYRFNRIPLAKCTNSNELNPLESHVGSSSSSSRANTSDLHALSSRATSSLQNGTVEREQ